MINGYTKGEICMLYREAKNKNSQIRIITELTGLKVFEVERILEEGGYLVAIDIEKLKELHTKGLSIKAIAEELEIGQSTVNYHMKKLGLKPNGISGRKKKEVKPMEKEANYDVVEKLKDETKKNIEELEDVLPKFIPEPDDLPIDYDIVDTLTPQQYYELAKITLELLKAIWI